MSGRVTIKTVAELAGVSWSTVSRVINGKDSVRPDLRKRVLDAMKTLDYSPNRAARSLVKQSSQTLGVVIPDITNVFFARVVRAIQDTARYQEYHTIICNTDWDVRKEKEEVMILKTLQVDGVLIAPANPAQSAHLKDIGLPLVLITRAITGFCSVETDHYAGGLAVARHLVELGHTKIGYIGDTSDPKFAGFSGYLISRGLPSDFLVGLESKLAPDEMQIHNAFEVAKGLLSYSPRPTAIFGANDFIALGVLNAARKIELAVPEDLAIVGFDDMTLAMATTPPLTTVGQSSYEIGRIATETLVRFLEGEADELSQCVTLNPRLIVRESTFKQ